MMGDLDHLDRRRTERQRHLGLGVGRQQEVEGAVGGEQDDCVMMRFLALDTGPIRPEDAEAEPAQPVDQPDPRRDDANALLARLCKRRSLVDAASRLERVEDEPDLEVVDDLGRAADMVAMGG